MKLPMAISCALLLAACGGGGGDAPVVPVPVVSGTDVPASATQSAAGALAFTASVAATPNDAAEPLALGDAQLGSSETDEPAPI